MCPTDAAGDGVAGVVSVAGSVPASSCDDDCGGACDVAESAGTSGAVVGGVAGCSGTSASCTARVDGGVGARVGAEVSACCARVASVGGSSSGGSSGFGVGGASMAAEVAVGRLASTVSASVSGAVGGGRRPRPRPCAHAGGGGGAVGVPAGRAGASARVVVVSGDVESRGGGGAVCPTDAAGDGVAGVVSVAGSVPASSCDGSSHSSGCRILEDQSLARCRRRVCTQSSVIACSTSSAVFLARELAGMAHWCATPPPGRSGGLEDCHESRLRPCSGGIFNLASRQHAALVAAASFSSRAPALAQSSTVRGLELLAAPCSVPHSSRARRVSVIGAAVRTSGLPSTASSV